MKLTIIRLENFSDQDRIDLQKIWPEYSPSSLLVDDNHRIYAARFNDRLLAAVRVTLSGNAVKNMFRAGPAGIRTTQAFSQDCRWDSLDDDRANGCIRSLPIVFNVFSAQILSLKPEIHSRNEDKLCVKQLKKTAIVQFILRW